MNHNKILRKYFILIYFIRNYTNTFFELVIGKQKKTISLLPKSFSVIEFMLNWIYAVSIFHILNNISILNTYFKVEHLRKKS